MFVGIYKVKGVGKAKRGLIDPISGKDVGGLNFYDLELGSQLADYRGRLTIDWGKGYRAWVQRAGKQEKPIKEIHRAASEPPFPGFLDFYLRGRENILKRLVVHSGAANLGLLMRKLFGKGTPRGLAQALPVLISAAEASTRLWSVPTSSPIRIGV